MDTEDEGNSYLQYLNDSETQNTFLLETSEVGMFSEEPIFTEIDAADWPQEGFPLLLTNPLIAEEEQPEDRNSASLDKCDNNSNVDSNFSINNKEQNSNLVEEDEKEETRGETHIIELFTEGSKTIPVDNSLFKVSKNQQIVRNINDLFSTVLANKCKICPYLCENLEQIKAHISEKHSNFFNGNGISVLIQNQKKQQLEEEGSEGYTVYVCGVCSTICVNQQGLREHMMQFHGLGTETENTNISENNKEKPSILRKTLLPDLTVNMIKKQEKILQKIKCSFKGCNAGFPSEEICKKHESLHEGEHKSVFRCSECGQKFKMWRIAQNHMFRDHGIEFGMITCPMCNKFKSYNAVTILKHMVIHSNERPYMCSDCGKSFKQWAQLKNHEIIHRQPEELPAWCKVKKCNICDRYLSNSKSLKTHIQSVHENFKPFICNICGHKTARKAMLELHLRQHTGVKPHKCNYCPYKTADYNCLRKHVMKHIGGFQYKCPHCTYTCIQSGSLKNHLKNRHRDKEGTFTCLHCPFSTINHSIMEAHKKKHENSDNTVKKVAVEAPAENKDRELQADEETQNCFLNSEQVEETIDSGGITIPAGLELHMES